MLSLSLRYVVVASFVHKQKHAEAEEVPIRWNGASDEDAGGMALVVLLLLVASLAAVAVAGVE